MGVRGGREEREMGMYEETLECVVCELGGVC